MGTGINLTQTADELPVPTAISLRQAGAGVDREELLSTVLSGFGTLLARWEHAGGDGGAGIRADYLEHLATIGSTVTVQLPADHRVTGRAVDVTVEGMLVLDGDDGTTRRFAAGDVVHLRR